MKTLGTPSRAALVSLGLVGLCVHSHVPESSPALSRIGPPVPEGHDRLSVALDGLVFEDGRARPMALLTELEDAEASRKLLQEGRLQLRAGRRTEAVGLLARAAIADPSQAEPYEELGRALRSLDEVDKAQAAYRTALDLDPGRPSALADLARTLELQARHGEAVSVWQDVLRAPTTSREARGTAHARLAVDAYYDGDRVAATRHLAAAESLDARVPQALVALIETGRPRRAAVRTVSGSGIATIGSPIRVDTGAFQAAEVSVALGASMEAVAAWNDLREPGGVDAWSLGWGVSFDGGTTWSDSLLRPPGAAVTKFEGDPMTAYDPRTGNMWIGGVTFTAPRNVFVARKRPGAAALDPAILINQDDSFDKGLLAVGPVPGFPSSTRLYVTYNQGLQWSADLGSTWSELLPLEFGVSQHPRVGPGGELYVSYFDFIDSYELQRSFDAGLTVTGPILIASRLDPWGLQDGSRFPGRFRVPPLAFLAVDPDDGTLYCVYSDTTAVSGGEANVDVYLTRSTDQGDAWTVPVVVNGDADPPGDQFFPWLEVAASGRLHLLFFDSRHTVQADDALDGLFDVYYASSGDGGDSWTEVRLTASSFGSAAATWPGFEQFMGDYIGLAVSGDQVLAVYPATFDGDLDIWAQRIQLAEIFADGFESGDTGTWSSTLGTERASSGR